MAYGPPELSPDELVDLAHQLRDLGVSEFSLHGFFVKFKDAIALPEEVSYEKVASPPVPRTLNDRAKQFGLGKLPFPGQPE